MYSPGCYNLDGQDILFSDSSLGYKRGWREYTVQEPGRRTFGSSSGRLDPEKSLQCFLFAGELVAGSQLNV